MTMIPAGYREDSTGALRPVDSIKQIDLLRDELVNSLAARAELLSSTLAAFKRQAMDEIEAFISLSASEYNRNLGGKKGNVSLTSFNGQYRATRANHDSMSFDERLVIAKDLIDECLLDWCGRPGVPRGLVAIANRAFRRNAAGEISVSRVLDLRSHEIEDERWKKAMDIITDSIQVHASITYFRFYKRAGKTDQYNQIPLDMGSV
jgi:hypothetical protein